MTSGVGLSIYVHVGHGAAGRDPGLMAQQIRLVRQMGIHGYCLFVAKYLDDGRLELLKTKVNAEPAVAWWK